MLPAGTSVHACGVCEAIMPFGVPDALRPKFSKVVAAEWPSSPTTSGTRTLVLSGTRSALEPVSSSRLLHGRGGGELLMGSPSVSRPTGSVDH